VPSPFEQLLLPAECLLCRNLLSFPASDQVVCDVCRYRWRPIVRPWCERCGQPGPHFGPCRLCREWPPALTQARSAVWLDDGAREAAHALKYGGLPRIADDLAAAITRHVPAPAPGAVLVPIPLGARWRLPVRTDLLARRRETATQTALTPAARLANVAGAFETGNAEVGTRNDRRQARSAFRVPSSPLVLVDDVFTTGATLAEAARALGHAGAVRITAVTFGRAAIPDFT